MTGSSKVLLVCGFSVAFGVYTSLIQKTNNRIIELGDQKSFYTEVRMVATAGLNHAINNASNPSSWNIIKHNGTVNVDNLLAGGDTVSYSVNNFQSSDSSVRVTVTAKFGGVAAKQMAIIKRIPEPTSFWPYMYNKKDGWGNLYCKWQVGKVYLYPYQAPS